jgi:hypothetical protein
LLSAGHRLARCGARFARYTLGLVRAVIEMPLMADYRELIPHEFEHVIEPIEGIDLAALARAGEGQAVEIARGGSRPHAPGRRAARPPARRWGSRRATGTPINTSNAKYRLIVFVYSDCSGILRGMHLRLNGRLVVIPVRGLGVLRRAPCG